MVIVEGTFRLPPDVLDRARPAMARFLAANRAEQGCRSFSFAEDVLDPGLIRVFELWGTRDDLDRHAASAHVADWRATGSELGVVDRDLRIYDAGEPRPL